MTRPQRVAAMGVLVSALMCSPAAADLTMTSRTGGKGLGMVAETETVTHLKGLKLRSDVTVRGEKLTTIVDLDAARFISLNHKTREADIYDVRAIASDLQKVTDADVKVTLTPTGQRRAILNRTCVEYAVKVDVGVMQRGEPITVVMQGPVWIAPDSPGVQDWARFYGAASDKRLFFTDPRAARADPGRAEGLTSLYRRMAALGVPYATEIEIRFEGSGAMAELMKKMGATSMTSAVIALSTESISSDLFLVPAGYTSKQK